MKIRPLVIYHSQKDKSNTFKVAKKISILLNIKNKKIGSFNFNKYNFFIIVCATYGDEELPFEVEDFLENLSILNKKYCICELGNYFGTKEKEFGAAKIIEDKLNYLKWEKVHKTLSLDTVPNIRHNELEKWIFKLKWTNLF